jgi:hypothetical protein
LVAVQLKCLQNFTLAIGSDQNLAVVTAPRLAWILFVGDKIHMTALMP